MCHLNNVLWGSQFFEYMPCWYHLVYVTLSSGNHLGTNGWRSYCFFWCALVGIAHGPKCFHSRWLLCLCHLPWSLSIYLGIFLEILECPALKHLYHPLGLQMFVYFKDTLVPSCPLCLSWRNNIGAHGKPFWFLLQTWYFHVLLNFATIAHFGPIFTILHSHWLVILEPAPIPLVSSSSGPFLVATGGSPCSYSMPTDIILTILVCYWLAVLVLFAGPLVFSLVQSWSL